MFRLVCYSVNEIINILENVKGSYIATDSDNNAYIIRGFDKIHTSKEVFEYIVENYNLTIGTI